MQLYHLIVPLLFYLVYIYLSKMFLSLIGICVLIHIFFYLICVIIFDCDITLGFVEKFGKNISSLQGKVVFITGASSGIGEYTALALAKDGVRLVLAARRKTELERVKKNCLVASKGKLKLDDILVLPMDVVKYDLHQHYFDEALRHFGQVDILVNNAGRSQRAEWEKIDMAVDKEMFDLNVFGVISFTRIAVKYFLEKKQGHVAVTSSVAGLVGAPFSGTYTGSKHAIHGYFNSLRNEKLMENLTVTVLCPGPTFTDFLAHAFTAIQGETYGKTTSPTDKRMSGERCGHLCAVALANKLDEAWMAILPIIPLLYVVVYCPVLYKIIMKLCGPEKIFKLRDSKVLEFPTDTVNP